MIFLKNILNLFKSYVRWLKMNSKNDYYFHRKALLDCCTLTVPSPLKRSIAPYPDGKPKTDRNNRAA